MRILCIKFVYTICLKTWQTSPLIGKAFTRMFTWMSFSTTLPHQLDAIFFITNILKCLNTMVRWLGHYIPTEPAFSRSFLVFGLFAIIVYMIWANLAANAEIICAFVASHSVFSHVFSCLSRHSFTIIVTCRIVYFCLLKLERRFATFIWTFNNLRAHHLLIQLVISNFR